MLAINVEKRLNSFIFAFNQTLDCQGITAILGVSGSGKSTLINLINGLVKPDHGSIKFNDNLLVDVATNYYVTAQQRRIGTVFQDALLFPHLTVNKNLTYGMPAMMSERFNEIIEVLNIQHILQRYPAMLSGGEKQRVAIGRAVLTNPQLLLMDEPLSALDMPRKKELIAYIQQLVNEMNIPIIYVTHNINEVKKLATNVAIIEQGKLYRYGDTATMLRDDYLADWL